MRVICTGISGTERVGFLEEVRALAARAGRDLQIFDVREAMFQVAEDVGEPVEDYKGGKVSAAGRLVGEVMKATRGRANPGVVKDVLFARLDAL